MPPRLQRYRGDNYGDTGGSPLGRPIVRVFVPIAQIPPSVNCASIYQPTAPTSSQYPVGRFRKSFFALRQLTLAMHISSACLGLRVRRRGRPPFARTDSPRINLWQRFRGSAQTLLKTPSGNYPETLKRSAESARASLAYNSTQVIYSQPLTISLRILDSYITSDASESLNCQSHNQSG